MAGSSTRPLRNICVFCGSSKGNKEEFLSTATALGETLANQGLHLVYGGGSLGLMGAVATAAHRGGSKVLGITPEVFTSKETDRRVIGEQIKVSSIPERIQLMQENSDAFVALPGGLGTLEEIFQMASWAQLNIHQKPIGLLNVKGFYDPLLSFLDSVKDLGFMSPLSRRILLAAATPEELLDQLNAFQPQLDPFLAALDWSTKEDGKKRKRE